MKKFAPEISFLLIAAFLNMVMGCSYYRVKTIEPAADSASVIEQKQSGRKYLILHQGENVWHLKNVKVDNDKKEMIGTLETLSADHFYYKKTKIPGVNRFKQSDNKLQKKPTFEVHIYITEYSEAPNSQIIIPFTSIKKIELYDLAVGATVASYTFTTIGILVGVAAILAVIIALTKSSCPFVYVSDGYTYHFTGEMYGGAIYSSLERDDYMPLPGFISTDNNYQLKISNELLERQYTNLAELMVVEHPENSSILIDKNGVVQTLLSPLAPSMAISGNSIDQTNTVLLRDSSSFLFNEDQSDGRDLSSLTLSFKRPHNSKTGKLVLNAKNSLWLDFVYGKFNEQFGTAFNKFAEKQKKVPAAKNIQWSLDQGIPLSVYVETEKGWEFVDYFNVIGPLASRDMVMPIDLAKVKGEEVKIKLQCGFMFWEVDYAVMDFSENIPIEIKHLSPASAIDERGVEVSSLLASSDDKYLIQPEVGNEVVVRYPATLPRNGYRQTSFLHSRGYYEYIREYKNKPNLIYLNSFKKKGAFTRFSKERYSEFVNSKDFFATALNHGNGN